MAGRTSSAQPRQLYRYADVALRLDSELGSESSRPAPLYTILKQPVPSQACRSGSVTWRT